MSLLDKAQTLRAKVGTKKQCTQDEVELAIAWFHGRISSKQAAHALNMEKAMGVTAWCADILKIALATQRADLVAIDEDDAK
jgi:hypothetical protein